MKTVNNKYNNFSECIGNTPLIKLNRASEITDCEIYGKCEFLNPGGSIKDRAALQILKDALYSKKLTKIIDDIHSTKEILGDYKKECQKEEMEMRKISRKSLTLNRNIRKNQKIKRNYLTLKRPGSGILFTNIKKILGKRAKRHLKKDYQPKLNDLKK